MAHIKRPFIHHQKQNGLISAIREIIFGLEDGLVSTLGAITGVAGGLHDSFAVVLTGFVIVAVESLSMAAGTYLSSKSEQEVAERMLAEERHEIETEPEHETAELYEMYEARGFTKDEAHVIVNRIVQNKEAWLEEMAFRELGIVPSKIAVPKKNALFMGVSYIIGGIIPVTPYLFLPINNAVGWSLVSTVTGLFLVGALKTRFTQIAWWKSGLEMASVSLVAAGLGYGIARLVVWQFGINV